MNADDMASDGEQSNRSVSFATANDSSFAVDRAPADMSTEEVVVAQTPTPQKPSPAPADSDVNDAPSVDGDDSTDTHRPLTPTVLATMARMLDEQHRLVERAGFAVSVATR